MKKIFVKPQVSAQPLKAEAMLMASTDPTVHTNESATEGGTALSKTGGVSTFHQQDIMLDL